MLWGAMGQHLQQDPKDGIVLLQVDILDKEGQWPGYTYVQPQAVQDSHSSALAARLFQAHCMVQGPASSLQAWGCHNTAMHAAAVGTASIHD